MVHHRLRLLLFKQYFKPVEEKIEKSKRIPLKTVKIMFDESSNDKPVPETKEKLVNTVSHKSAETSYRNQEPVSLSNLCRFIL